MGADGEEDTPAFARSVSPPARREIVAIDGFHDRVSANNKSKSLGDFIVFV